MLKSEYVPDVELVLVVELEHVDLALLLEGYLQLALLLAAQGLPPLALVRVGDALELTDYPLEFQDHRLHLHDHVLQHLGLLLHVVGFS